VMVLSVPYKTQNKHKTSHIPYFHISYSIFSFSISASHTEENRVKRQVRLCAVFVITTHKPQTSQMSSTLTHIRIPFKGITGIAAYNRSVCLTLKSAFTPTNWVEVHNLSSQEELFFAQKVMDHFWVWHIEQASPAYIEAELQFLKARAQLVAWPVPEERMNWVCSVIEGSYWSTIGMTNYNCTETNYVTRANPLNGTPYRFPPPPAAATLSKGQLKHARKQAMASMAVGRAHVGKKRSDDFCPGDLYFEEACNYVASPRGSKYPGQVPTKFYFGGEPIYMVDPLDQYKGDNLTMRQVGSSGMEDYNRGLVMDLDYETIWGKDTVSGLHLTQLACLTGQLRWVGPRVPELGLTLEACRTLYYLGWFDLSDICMHIRPSEIGRNSIANLEVTELLAAPIGQDNLILPELDVAFDSHTGVYNSTCFWNECTPEGELDWAGYCGTPSRHYGNFVRSLYDRAEKSLQLIHSNWMDGMDG